MTFISSFILGLLASAHCAAMCSGLHQAMQSKTALLSSARQIQHTLVMSIGRIVTYVLIGSLLAGFSYGLWHLVSISKATEIIRIATACLLVLISIQLLFKRVKVFVGLDFVARTIWKPLVKIFPNSDANSLWQSFLKGSILGFLPCGLLYAVFFTAALTGDMFRGASVMLGFGLGTVPSLTFTGVLWMQFKRWFHNSGVRIAGALFFFSGGLLVFFAPYLVSTDFSVGYPGLVNLMFCT